MGDTLCWNGNCPQVRCPFAHLRPPPPKVPVIPKWNIDKTYNFRSTAKKQEETKDTRDSRRRSRSLDKKREPNRETSIREEHKSHTTDRVQNLQPIYGNSHNYTASGLKNLGNTCYMNAVLQCFAHIGMVGTSLGKMKTAKGSLLDELRFLLTAINSGDFRRITPIDFKSKVDQQMTYFSGLRQHDAHDFMTKLMNKTDEEVEKSKKTDDEPKPKLSDVFQGKIESTLTCIVCKNVVQANEDPFTSLHVDILGEKSCITKSLENELKQELIEYTCEECSSGKSLKDSEFKMLPEVLAVHIKRFSQDNDRWTTKNHSAVKYPALLKIEEVEFELNAGVHHSGGMSSGHYVALCKQEATGKWYSCDDETIKEVNVRKEESSRRAYILFYTKKKGKENSGQKEREPNSQTGNSEDEGNKNIQEMEKRILELEAEVEKERKEAEKLQKAKEKSEASQKKKESTTDGNNTKIQELKRKNSEMAEKTKADKTIIDTLKKELRDKKKENQEKEKNKEEYRKKAEQLEQKVDSMEKEAENDRKEWTEKEERFKEQLEGKNREIRGILEYNEEMGLAHSLSILDPTESDDDTEEVGRLKREIAGYEKRLSITLGQLAEKERTNEHMAENMKNIKKMNENLLIQITLMSKEKPPSKEDEKIRSEEDIEEEDHDNETSITNSTESKPTDSGNDGAEQESDEDTKERQQICPYFIENRCRYGESCKWKHQKAPGAGNICRFFVENRCHFGRRCRNLHPQSKNEACLETNHHQHPKNLEKGVKKQQPPKWMKTAEATVPQEMKTLLEMMIKNKNMEMAIDILTETALDTLMEAGDQGKKDRIGHKVALVMSTIKELRNKQRHVGA